MEIVLLPLVLLLSVPVTCAAFLVFMLVLAFGIRLGQVIAAIVRHLAG